jgi:hypothetical protein
MRNKSVTEKGNLLRREAIRTKQQRPSRSISCVPPALSKAARPSAANVQLEHKRRLKMKVLSIFAIVLSLIGGANVAFAQSTRDQGVVTGSQSNNAEHTFGGYTPDGR